MRSAWKVRVAGWISRPAPAAERAGHDLRQTCRRRDRRSLPLPDNRPCDAATPGLFAVAPDQVGQLALREGIHQIARRSALLGIEAHVERSLVSEGEPSLRLIELERRQPEIEQDAIERRNPSLSGNDGEIGKVGVDRDEALADAGVLLQRECAVDRGGIGVESDNDSVWRRCTRAVPGYDRRHRRCRPEYRPPGRGCNPETTSARSTGRWPGAELDVELATGADTIVTIRGRRRAPGGARFVQRSMHRQPRAGG